MKKHTGVKTKFTVAVALMKAMDHKYRECFCYETTVKLIQPIGKKEGGLKKYIFYLSKLQLSNCNSEIKSILSCGPISMETYIMEGKKQFKLYALFKKMCEMFLAK